MADFKGDIDLICATCGAAVVGDEKQGMSNTITVDPCEVCIEAAKDDGREEGREEGRD